MAPDGGEPQLELPPDPWANIPLADDGDLQLKGPQTFWHGLLPADGDDRTSQVKAPSTPWPDMLPTDKVKQVEQYGFPRVSKTAGGMSQFKVPPTPSMQA